MCCFNNGGFAEAFFFTLTYCVLSDMVEETMTVFPIFVPGNTSIHYVGQGSLKLLYAFSQIFSLDTDPRIVINMQMLSTIPSFTTQTELS